MQSFSYVKNMNTLIKELLPSFISITYLDST